MTVPAGLFLLSLAGVALALLLPGASDWLLLAGPAALASLILWLQSLGRTMAAEALPWVILDGSNVMHWRDGTPQADTLRAVVVALERAGFTPGVVCDANVGYKLTGRHMHEGDLAAVLGLPRSQVRIVAAGQPADPVILQAARDHGVRIVTNDRFRDWAETFPEVAAPGRLIRGGFRDGQLWLEL